ncbi:MAG: hypothetical protein U0V70_20830 [Terriglobia bacterium]
MNGAMAGSALATLSARIGADGLKAPDASALKSRVQAEPSQASSVGQEDPPLLKSMQLAGQNLLTALNPNENYLPYFIMKIGKDYKAFYEFTWPSHNIGRWLDALLRLEKATGFVIPVQLEAAMLENLRLFFDNPDNLLIPPPRYAQLGEPPNLLEIHSMRESLLALNALALYRGNRWALEQAHRMMETVWRVSRANGDWDYDGLEAVQHMQRPPRMDPTQSHGRLIEALVWFYETSGDPLAMKLATRFATYHLENTTSADGTLNLASKADHTHSYLGTLRGLVLYGELTNQRQYIERVASTYRTYVLGHLIKPSGVISHGMQEEGNAEPASAGDVVQLGLWLSRNGYPEFLEDVERLVRSRLLPSQIVKRPGLKPAVDDGSDSHRNLDARVVGGFAGMHEPYWGRNPATDITCAVLHSLVDVYQHVAVQGPMGLTVNLHFDYEDERIRISAKQEERAEVLIVPKSRQNLAIRIPAWAPPDSIRLTVNGQPISPTRIGSFAYIPRDVLPEPVLLQYGLPVRRQIERIAGVDYTLTWKGNRVIGITPNSDFLPLYPTAVD